jgi:pimeloyl-ACP methyl ester carboxylesterase
MRREPITIAERGHFFISGELVKTDAGTLIKNQCLVRYEFPFEVLQPYPVVMVHGGGGQGLDYYTTADGREGWAADFLRAGYQVYVIDRQGHGGAFYDPDLLGPMGPPASLELIGPLFASKKDSPMNPFGHLHSQWPGSGEADDPALLNFLASQGRAIADLGESHRLMRRSAEDLLRRIGPAVLITNSAGGAWGWQAADAAPDLVKGIVCIEGAFMWSMPFGPPSGQADLYAFSAAPLAFDPPIASLKDIRLEPGAPAEPGSAPFLRQAAPARKLAHFSNIPVGYVTGEASFARSMTEGVLANMRQLGLDVDDLSLWKHGIRGNGHVPMDELNSSEVAAFLIGWIDRRVASR